MLDVVASITSPISCQKKPSERCWSESLFCLPPSPPLRSPPLPSAPLRSPPLPSAPLRSPPLPSAPLPSPPLPVPSPPLPPPSPLSLPLSRSLCLSLPMAAWIFCTQDGSLTGGVPTLLPVSKYPRAESEGVRCDGVGINPGLRRSELSYMLTAKGWQFSEVCGLHLMRWSKEILHAPCSRHPNILNLHSVFRQPTNGQWVLILDCEALRDILTKLVADLSTVVPSQASLRTA